MNKLNEDEAIEILKTMCTDNFCIEQLKTKQAIETILDLYKQEKEKNKELEEKQNRLAFKTNQYMNDVLSNNIVSKDKIRAKMEEIMNYTYISREERQQQNYAYDRLKELLEEN